MSYQVCVSIACQFDDTNYDYLDDPVYIEWFDDYEKAQNAYYTMGGIDKHEVAERFRANFPECVAFDAEVSITKDGCDFGFVDDVEWFDVECIWSNDEKDN